MSHRARLLTLPITWRYALTFVDARGLNEDMLPLRAAMLHAISCDDKEVTETPLPEAEVPPQEQEAAKSEPEEVVRREPEHLVEEEEEEDEEQEEEEEEEDAPEEDAEEEEEESEEEEERKHPQPTMVEIPRPVPLPEPKDDSGSDQDEFFNIAHANENAARKLMAKYLKIRTAIRKHSTELANLQRELAALDPSIGGDAALPRESDLHTFTAFMEHQEQNAKAGREDETIAATVKRLENDKYEGRQRLARNTAKLFGLAGPWVDPGALVEDPDVAAALEECSGTPNVVSRVMGSPVATLGLSLAQMISANLQKPSKKEGIYNTQKWKRWVASRQT